MSAEAFTPVTTETKLTLPFNGSIYTTRREAPAEAVAPLIGSTMEAILGASWADSLVIGSSIIPDRNRKIQQITHARIPTEANQLATNWEYSTCSMGGQRFPSVQRTVILLASTVAHATPAFGSAMPVEGNTSIFYNQGYILMDRSVMRSGMELEPVFRVERRNYVLKSTSRQIGVDPLNGLNLTSQTDLYYATEIVAQTIDPIDAPDGYPAAVLFTVPTNPFWGIQSNGTQRTGNQLSCGWYSIETAQIVGGVFSAGVVNCGSYTTNDPFYWPPVLETYEMLDWVRNDGGVELYPALRFHPEGYDGPCHTTITRTWSKTPFTISVVDQMKPTRIYYACPYYTVNIPECLHVQAAFQCDIGSGDPIYDLNTGSTRYFAATNHTTWPDTITAYDDQEPFRGGYLRTTRVVTKPTVPASIGWTSGT